jgi:uncharacterized peroxidase-related enzyme
MSTERPISRLPVPEEATLPDDIRALFDQMRVKPGFVPNVYRALSANPQQLRGFIALYQAIMEQDAGLSKAEREMIAVVVSAANHCAYCQISHGAALRIRTRDAVLSDMIAANYRNADLSPRQRAMLDFALKLTEHSAACSETDVDLLREAGFGDADILDIVQTAAFFNYSNRLASGLGLLPNHEYVGLARTPKERRDPTP